MLPVTHRLLPVVLLAAALAVAQAPLTFEVASVKPSPPDERRGIIYQPPGNQSYEAAGVPLRLMMTVAYSVTDRQIAGGPDWVNTDRWNINAKAERRGTSDELHAALARLLEERFQLKVRHESRELPVYILTVDKKGPKLPVHDPADLVHMPFGGRAGNLSGHNVTMNYFAFFLSRILDRNVIDRTELPEHYDVDFHFVPDAPPGAGRKAPLRPPRSTARTSSPPSVTSLACASKKVKVRWISW